MSLQAITWAMKQETGSSTRKLVLVMLADFHNEKTGRCDPSIALMAERAECSDRTIRYALKELVVGGLIARHQRAGTSTQYTLSMDTPAKSAPLQDLHPCNTCTPPLQDLQGTPATVAPKPALNRKEPALKSRGSRTAHPATRLPEDFELTDERRLVAEAEKLPAERTFAKFVDYWRAASGAKARKHDWEATWRNWCRTEADYRSRGSNGSQGSRKTRFDELMGGEDGD